MSTHMSTHMSMHISMHMPTHICIQEVAWSPAALGIAEWSECAAMLRGDEPLRTMDDTLTDVQARDSLGLMMPYTVYCTVTAAVASITLTFRRAVALLTPCGIQLIG